MEKNHEANTSVFFKHIFFKLKSYIRQWHKWASINTSTSKVRFRTVQFSITYRNRYSFVILIFFKVAELNAECWIRWISPFWNNFFRLNGRLSTRWRHWKCTRINGFYFNFVRKCFQQKSNITTNWQMLNTVAPWETRQRNPYLFDTVY